MGPAASPFCWKSLRCSFCFGSTWPCTGFEPSFFSAELGVPTLAGVFGVLGVVAEEDPLPAGDGVEGVVDDFVAGSGLRSQPASVPSASATARETRVVFMPEPSSKPRA